MIGRADERADARFLHAETFLEDERRREIQWPRAAHGEIVDRAMDGDAADVSAGKEDGRDDEGIGREREARIADFEDGLVVELVERGIAEGGKKNLVDEVRGELASAAVAQNDLFVIEDGERAGAEGVQRLGCRVVYVQLIFSCRHG